MHPEKSVDEKETQEKYVTKYIACKKKNVYQYTSIYKECWFCYHSSAISVLW